MPSPQPLPRLLSIDQLADHLGVTPRHVRRLIAERRVPFLRVGRFVRFDPLRGFLRNGSYVRGRVMGPSSTSGSFGLVIEGSGLGGLYIIRRR